MSKKFMSMLTILGLLTLAGCGDGVGGENLNEGSCALDPVFQNNLGTGFNGAVDSITLQNDGKILVGGRFTQFQSATRFGMLRLESSGLADNAFNNLAVPTDSVFAIALDSDRSIYLGGSFASISGQSAAKIAKLSDSGQVDVSFASQMGSAPNGDVSALAVDGVHRLLVGGNFNSASGVTANHLLRYSSAGLVDSSFAASLASGFDLGVDSISVLAGDSYLIAGSFSTFQGRGPGRFTRLTDAGLVQQGFVQELGSGFDNAVKSVVERSAGGFVVAGSFSSLNSVSKNYLAAVGADGVPDLNMQINFPTTINATVQVLTRQSNGKLLVGGDYSKGIYRLDEDGREDIVFSSACGAGFDGSVFAIVQLNDGSLLIGGDFTHFNGAVANRLVHLQ